LAITPLCDTSTSSELLTVRESTVTVRVKATQETRVDAAAVGLHARLGFGLGLGVFLLLGVLDSGSLRPASASVLGHRWCGEGEA
jgi:hypothetical protein